MSATIYPRPAVLAAARRCQLAGPSLRDVAVACGVLTAHNLALARFLRAMQRQSALCLRQSRGADWFRVEWPAAVGAEGFITPVVKPTKVVRDALATVQAVSRDVHGVHRTAGEKQRCKGIGARGHLRPKVKVCAAAGKLSRRDRAVARDIALQNARLLAGGAA